MGAAYKNGKPEAITKRKGCWAEEVNKPGFVPQQERHSLRYRVKPSGEW